MKNKCSTHQVMTVIRRSMQLEDKWLIPEHKLFLAVIHQAVADLNNRDHLKSAYSWFHDDGFEIVCDYLGLNHEGVRAILRDAGLLQE